MAIEYKIVIALLIIESFNFCEMVIIVIFIFDWVFKPISSTDT